MKVEIEKSIAIIVLIFAALNIYAQDTLVIRSKYLKQPDTVLVYKPRHSTSDRKFPVVYLLHGYSEHYMQWSSIINLQQLADQYGFAIVTPEGFATFYLNSPVDPSSQYEDFFYEELVPKNHQLIPVDDKNIFISGLSMGGFGALYHFIRHTDYYNTAAATSGALHIDPDKFLEYSFAFWKNDRLRRDAEKVFGDPKIYDWSSYKIIKLIKEYPDFNRAFLIDCGIEDPLYPLTEDLKKYCEVMNIPVTFMQAPGRHDGNYWHSSIEYHFVYFKQHLRKE